MLTQKTLHALRIRGFTAAEIAQIQHLASRAPVGSDRRFHAAMVTHAACGGDPLALKLAPLVRDPTGQALDPALIDACMALGERLRAHMR